MRHVTIQTGRRSFMVEHDDALALLEQIQRNPGTAGEAAEQPLSHAVNDRGSADVRWSDNGKQGALNAIVAWVAAVGAPDIPDAILELRNELMRDLHVPSVDSN